MTAKASPMLICSESGACSTYLLRDADRDDRQGLADATLQRIGPATHTLC